MDDQEGPIRDALSRGTTADAATTLLALYKSELFAYALWLARTERYAEISYWDAEERVRRELGEFSWVVSARAWSHAVLREAVKTAEVRQPVLSVVFDPRTQEPRAPHRKFVFPEHADQSELLRLLRLRFLEDDQELLLLRWSRELPWREIAFVLGGVGTAVARIDEEGERLRTRFDVLRERAAFFREELRRRPS
jgi:hypothetical protein